MPKILITAGNVFDPTFDGVCYAVKTVFGEIEAIHIFDTQESADYAEKSQRNARIRVALGNIDINTSLVSHDNLQIVVPERISRAIRNYGIDQIIVDLSNGQKITASVLYAVSTISRIDHIYTLEFRTKITKETKIADLVYRADWDYVRILPLKEILNITQSSYVELVYYRDRIAVIASKIEEKNHSLASDVRDRLEHSLVDYFTLSTLDGSPERLERCVNGLGKICEDIAEIWHEYCVNNGILSSRASDFNSRIDQIAKQWSEYRRLASSGNLDILNGAIANSVVPTLVIDKQMQSMRVYRNLASHSKRYYHYTKHDARLALDTTLLILERIASSDIIQPKRGDSQVEQ
jgi:hypothetical protein